MKKAVATKNIEPARMVLPPLTKYITEDKIPPAELTKDINPTAGAAHNPRIEKSVVPFTA